MKTTTFGRLGKFAVASLLSASYAHGQDNTVCDRACLLGFADRYFDAQAANDPSSLPLAPGVKFTENGAGIPLGEGLWRTADETAYRLDIANPAEGAAATLAVVREGAALVMQMLRLKVVDGRITEIETIVVRDGDSDPIWAPETLVGTEPSRNFTLSIRPSEQDTYHGLIAAAEGYWRAFETNGTPEYQRAPLLPTTVRTENGVVVTTATGVANIAPQTAAQGFDEGRYPNRRVYDRRYPVVDVERGVVLAIVRFGSQPGKRTPNIPVGDAPLIAEFFQVQSGKIVEVQVVMSFALRETQPTGWEAP